METPWNPRGGRGEAASGDSSTPSPVAAAAPSSVRASSSAGRVFPAPGAAESRKGPSRQAASSSSARSCQARSAGVDGVFMGLGKWRIVKHAADVEFRQSLRNSPEAHSAPARSNASTRQLATCPSPGSRRTSPAPERKASGAQVIGSIATPLLRWLSGSVSPVNTITY